MKPASHLACAALVILATYQTAGAQQPMIDLDLADIPFDKDPDVAKRYRAAKEKYDGQKVRVRAFIGERLGGTKDRATFAAGRLERRGDNVVLNGVDLNFSTFHEATIQNRKPGPWVVIIGTAHVSDRVDRLWVSVEKIVEVRAAEPSPPLPAPLFPPLEPDVKPLPALPPIMPFAPPPVQQFEPTPFVQPQHNNGVQIAFFFKRSCISLVRRGSRMFHHVS